MSTPPTAAISTPASQPMRLTLYTLESWLWESANILRGSIDPKFSISPDQDG